MFQARRTSRALRAPLRAPLHALAIAAALTLGAPLAQADAIVNGSVSLGGFSFAGGAGDFLFPDQAVWIGFAGASSATTGSLQLNGGSQARFSSVVLAQQFSNTGAVPSPGWNFLRVEDAGTRLYTQGLNTGIGQGDVFVESGGLIDARSTACADKSFGFFFCSTRIGTTPGYSSTLSVSGAGSTYLTRSLTVAQIGGHNGGTVNGQAQAFVDVLDGATLRAWNMTLGAMFGTPQAPLTGAETGVGTLRVKGANSLFVVDGVDRAVDGTTSLPGTTAPYLNLGTFAGGTGKVFVSEGGTIRIERADSLSGTPFVIMGNGGTGEMRVSGPGSKLEVAPGTGGTSIQMGRRAGSTGKLEIDNGGVVTGFAYAGAGRAVWNSSTSVLDAGGSGTITVDGAGSVLRLDDASATGVGQLDIARGAGSTGTVTVKNGGKIEILGSVARPAGPNLLIGREAGDTGAPTTFTGNAVLNIQGAGSVVELRADDVANGFNPAVRVGRTGTGTGNLNISAGGKLIIEGNAASTQTVQRTTTFTVGGSLNFNNLTGGNGTALITGAGSEVLMKGNDRFASVGDGPGANGVLTISDGGKLTSTVMHVGRTRVDGANANGSVVMNNGQIVLEGKFDSGALGSTVGAGLVVGTDAGSVGTLAMSNGSSVQVKTLEPGRFAAVYVGGSTLYAGGIGSLVMSSGSSITIDGAGQSLLGVGLNGGTGSLSMNASSITMAANGQVDINGSAMLSNGSSIDAGSFLGVAAGGGVGSLLINNSSITATDIVIGAGGFLGGTGATINGNVTNSGIFSPGASPGVFTINGDFTNLGGKIVLEIESDGLGGFNTDKIIFGDGSNIDLGNVAIEFQFLGNTDAAAFLATGAFDIDTFIRKDNGNGGTVALDDGAFADVNFSALANGQAITGFSITDGGTVTAVPEPQTYALFGMGLAALAWARRRQGAAAAAA
jgi:hypothetical protein